MECIHPTTTPNTQSAGATRKAPNGVLTLNSPVYNSQIFQTYLKFLEKHHPEVDVERLLGRIGMTRYEIDDPAHWFSQSQANRFHAELQRQIKAGNTALEAGRFTIDADSMHAVKRYLLGMISPAAAFQLIGRYARLVSRTNTVTAKKGRGNSAELTFTPLPGSREETVQCENRKGLLEAIGKLFTGRHARVDHPECIHRGDRRCRYIASWKFSTAGRLKVWAKRLFLITLAAVPAAALLLPSPMSFILIAVNLTALALLSTVANRLEIGELKQLLNQQGDAAKAHIQEMTLRYNSALLAQEIGQATAETHDIREASLRVVEAIGNRLELGSCALFLVESPDGALNLAAGFGLPVDVDSAVTLPLPGPDESTRRSAMRSLIWKDQPFSADSLRLPDDPLRETADRFQMKTPLFFPILNDQELLGLLILDSGAAGHSISQSDLNVLKGISSQLGVAIRNSRFLESLKSSEEQLRLLTDNVTDLIWKVNSKTLSLDYVSPSITSLMGYQASEVVGRPLTDYLTSDSLDSVLAATGNPSTGTADTKLPGALELELVRKDGSRFWAEINMGAIRSESGRNGGFLGIARDITERKQAEADKRKLEERLQRAERMEAIGTLAGGVAHDLNNVLSGVVGFPELLLLDLPESSPLREPLEIIMKSGRKASAIVQDLLTLARRGVMVRKRVNLNDIVTDYLESPEHHKLLSFHPGAVVETDLSQPLPDISGSPVHLFKMLMNLVSNAAEAIPSEGRIRLTTGSRKVERSLPGYDKITAGNYVVLTVSDTGIGIPQRDLKRIFEPFYTKKVMGRSGTGLGMAVVWGTVKDHKGHIDVRSKEGVFTEFTVYLPAEATTRPDTASSETSPDILGHGETVLIVDDIEEQRQLAGKMLARLGYSVDTVSSGEAAVAYVEDGSPDLVILDMLMYPGIDGLETYLRILQRHPGQKAIITSGFSATDRVQEALDRGAGAYLRKPYRLEELGKAVKKALSAASARPRPE
ncbi:MAG: response regulator [Desulfobacterales bacterium]